MKFYEFLLIVTSLMIWLSMTGAKYAEYDINILFFGCAALISLMVTLFIVLTGIFKRQVVKASLLTTILFILTSSPLSIYLFIEFIGFKMKT